jgi:hypothetical protein
MHELGSIFRMRYSLRTLMAGFFCLAVGLVAVDRWPKSETLPIGEGFRGWYTGIGLRHGTGYFGKNFYKIEWSPTSTTHGSSTIYLDASIDGYYHIQGKYSNGELREDAMCYVSFPFEAVPFPDVGNVRDGKYWSPDGKTTSSIENRTGVQTYWCVRGRKLWELVLEDGRRVKARLWDEEGKLLSSE